MNDIKIVPILTDNSNFDKHNKEESFEDYQIIKEDYCSSPRCGIKSKIVTKSVERIIFTPLEISTKPYFKYCVTPVKDEHFKFDFSQSETNHTRIQEEKNQKKQINNNSNIQKNSYIDINKNELKEESESENENKDEKENEIALNTVYIDENKNNENNNNENNNKANDHIENLKINENIITNNEEKKAKLKNKKLKHKKVSLLREIQNNNININNNIHYSIILKEKRKLSFNESSENYKEKKKPKKSQKNMHNLLILDENLNNKVMDTEMNYNRNKPKNSYIFNSIRLTKDNIKNIKNIKKKISPFHMNKEKKEPIKVISSRTSTNLNRLKNKKKSKENKDEIKKTKTTNFLKDSLTIHRKNKDIKDKIKTKICETDNSDEKTFIYNRKKYSNSAINKVKKRLKNEKNKNLEEKKKKQKKKNFIKILIIIKKMNLI